MVEMLGSRHRLEELGEVLQDLLSRGGGRAGQLVAQELLGRDEEGQRSRGRKRCSVGGQGSTVVVWRCTIEGLGRDWRHLGVEGGPQGGQAGLQGGELGVLLLGGGLLLLASQEVLGQSVEKPRGYSGEWSP